MRRNMVWAAGLVLLADLGTKALGRLFLPTAGVTLLPGVELRVFENARGPFGFGPLWLAVLASLVVLALFLRRARSSRWRGVTFGILLGGGIANLGERMVRGATTDLLMVGGTTAVNAADVAVLAGALLLFLLGFRGRAPVAWSGGTDGR